MLQAPGIPIFIDSRASTLYDDDFAADYFSMMDAEEHWQEKFESYGVDAALVPTHSRIAAALRKQRPAWRVAYIDPRSALLFPPAGPTRTKLTQPSQFLPDGVDLKLSRGFRGRRRGNLEKASVELLAAQRMDPMQLFIYGELMFVASLREDADAVNRWLEAALEVYPRRWNPILCRAGVGWNGALRRGARGPSKDSPRKPVRRRRTPR